MRASTSRRGAEGSRRTRPTPRDQEFSLLPDKSHVVFVLLYIINIPHMQAKLKQKILPILRDPAK